VPFGENAFVWHDPEALDGRRPTSDRPERGERPERVEAPVAERVERPERAERGERSGRRGRGRGERSERIETSDAPRAEYSPAPRVDVAELEVAPLPPAVIEGPPADVWVELPTQDEAPKKARRPRSRGRKTADDAEALAEAAPDAPAVEAPSIEAPSVEAVEETPLVAAEVEIPAPVTEPEPVAVAAMETAPVSAEPDPAEILTPPEKPKRGWWRRG
jgi:ribonuclease E